MRHGDQKIRPYKEDTTQYNCVQTVYVHEATGTKRWDRPTSADDLTSDIAARQQQHAEKCVVVDRPVVWLVCV